jgi:hypothetical protein
VSPGLYRYSWTVFNEDTSRNVITDFGVAPVHDSVRCEAPARWWCIGGQEDLVESCFWGVEDPGDPPPDWIDEGWNLYVSEVDIHPGQSLGGFTLTSEAPPDTLTFFVEPFHQIPEMSDPYIRKSDRCVRGLTVGPHRFQSPRREGPSAARSPERVMFALRCGRRGSARAVFSFYLPRAAAVSASILDEGGRRVAVLDRAMCEAGLRVIVWDGQSSGGRPAVPGTYFLDLDLGGDRHKRHLFTID